VRRFQRVLSSRPKRSAPVHCLQRIFLSQPKQSTPVRRVKRVLSSRPKRSAVEGSTFCFVALFFLFPIPFPLSPAAFAQQTQPQQPIAYVTTEGVTVSGSLEVANGKALVGNNGAITAGDKTANISLSRGGSLRLCSTTTVHLSRDGSIADPQSSALMISLDRGALEASYATAKYSDVLMTPDFRILISGPGQADLKIRVSPKGDTCLDNHGTDAPYITVTSLLEGGLYRVQPNQRVLFEHGSLSEVVDNEAEPCGCPPAPTEPANSTAFPIAQSEGLIPSAPPSTTPVVPAGQAHAQVTVPLVYKSDAPPPPPPPDMAPASPPATPPATPVPPKPKKQTGFFQNVGHFFSKLFGGK
jgi:hypothetical protein